MTVVSSERTLGDVWGAIRVRWGVGRMEYAVAPGLYALGAPDARSSVLVTANYKLSFDALRSALPGRSVWILVLDTGGINVWCAAGKGTFGTEELCHRVQVERLASRVTHHRLILPQLGAPGVAGQEVQKRTGFHVVWGPIRADDLPAFLDAGEKATPRMRRKTFTLAERAVVIPVELVTALQSGVFIALALFFLAALGWPGPYWPGSLLHGTKAVLVLALANLAGAVFVPLALPWLPGRAFATKGAWAGLILAAPFLHFFAPATLQDPCWLEQIGLALLGVALSSFLAMNFTGASTYTSLSGVRKEMRWAVPCQILVFLIGLGLWVGARFLTL